MGMIQLKPAIPLLTPRGPALAHILIDYGEESDLLWVCFQNETGECWAWPNNKVRATANPSMGRPHIVKPPYEGNKSDKVTESVVDTGGKTKGTSGHPPITGPVWGWQL